MFAEEEISVYVIGGAILEFTIYGDIIILDIIFFVGFFLYKIFTTGNESRSS